MDTLELKLFILTLFIHPLRRVDSGVYCFTRKLKHSLQKPPTYGMRTADIHDKVCQNNENAEQHYAFSISSNETKDNILNVPVVEAVSRFWSEC